MVHSMKKVPHTIERFFALFISCLLATTVLAKSNDQPLTTGTYDVVIGNEKTILIVESADNDHTNGFFVLNRGKAVEDQHSFTLSKNGWFRSALYTGKLKLETTENQIFGSIKLIKDKPKFLFFRPKTPISITKRNRRTIAATSKYLREQFSQIDLKTDIIYGKAQGYWTETPYKEQPYIEVIAKGVGNYFKEMELLDLKMDIYQPRGDTLAQRPLILLIHGGAFYVGNRLSIGEKELATYFSKRGYVVASIDYRLGFLFNSTDIERSGYRAVQDAHAALRYLSSKATELRIDPNQVYVAGTSAGAIASLNVAFMDNDERPASSKTVKKQLDLGNIESSGNSLKNTFTIKAVGNMWGAVTDLSIIDPDEKISVISIHGTADDVVPYDHDYPFQSLYMFNRMVMDKMYGSKAIHDQLNKLKFRNKLISLDGQKHEPYLDRFVKTNQYMDTVKVQVGAFFFQETAPMLSVPQQQLQLEREQTIRPFYYEVINGQLIALQIEGGIQASNTPNDASIIWFSKTDKRAITLYCTNKYAAWNVKTYNFNLKK
jgi:hypothetical protein